MAMGDICGTNTSFSKCINPCTACEDMDSRSDEKRWPCGFLECKCGDADKHKRGCPCHFRLRTPTRDASEAKQPISRARMQQLGRTTLEHALVGVPGIHVSRAGMRDPMHTTLEGRTSQLGGMTMWHFAKSGLATPVQLKKRAQEFDWSPGEHSGRYAPNYLPTDLFTSTKVLQADESFVWGPHKDVKIPGSAVGVARFATMSYMFFKPFYPAVIPDWLLAWELHTAALMATFRFSAKFSELLAIEKMIVKSEQIIAVLPEYRACWIPKAHWWLHAASDWQIYGPHRMLTTLLNEMNNANIKLGVTRGNRLNPAKDAAVFWAEQSDYRLQTSTFGRSAVDSSESSVLVSGAASVFHDTLLVQLLLEAGEVDASSRVEFLAAFRFHRVLIQREDLVLLDSAVFAVDRVVRAGRDHYLLLHLVQEEVAVDRAGAYYLSVEARCEPSKRALSLTSSTHLTGLWTYEIREENRLYIVPKL